MPEHSTMDATTSATVALLRDPATIRRRARDLLAQARAGASPWFVVHDDSFPEAVAEVVDLTRRRFADRRIPYHSRWRHFEAGGVDRAARLTQALGTADAAELARARIDLALISVLLDAGAGARWHYREAATGQTHARSEGLAIATFDAFMAGAFSSDRAQPLRVDAQGLARWEESDLARAFQAEAVDNPLVGLSGRLALVHRLAQVLAERQDVFGTAARPGHLFDHLCPHGAASSRVTAAQMLGILLDTLTPIWLAPNALGGIALGDCWPLPRAGQGELGAGWMPFHKLSQWLTYSLVEPLEWAGVHVSGLHALTGLPEYRNGGLWLDTRVLRWRHARAAERLWRVGDEAIVEWRALTIALLDELADQVRAALSRTPEQMPLACVLEGGSWAAGRLLAQRLRGGTPPLRLDTDGTVF